MRRHALALGMACAALAAAAAPAPAAGSGVLDVRRLIGAGAGGSLGELEVTDARGQVQLRRELPSRRGVRVRARLAAGRYRLRLSEHACQAMCAMVDPRAARCALRTRVISGGRTGVRARVRPGRGCRLRARARPALFPPRGRLRAVIRLLRSRPGLNSWALIDSHGRMHGFAPGRTYVSASLVKAMLLVAYLRATAPGHPSPGERSLLGPMITESSNRAADAIYARLGDGPLHDLARRAGMRRFSISGYWGNAQLSAADQARFFRALDRLLPASTRSYARSLLSSVVGYQRWGFSRFSVPDGFRTFFKGGWRATARGRLVHEAALFERGPLRLSMAVLTDANPSHEAGTATLRAVARQVFAPVRAEGARRSAGTGTPAHRRAGLVDIHGLAPGVEVDLAYLTSRNLTGRRLPGYCRSWALLHKPAARSLARAQRLLRRRGFGLLVRDAYRPLRATRALVRWAERSGRADLVGTYIARRSRHNTGSAVDLTLVRRLGGRRLRMGSGYDHLGPAAHTRNATGRALRNRLLLERAMERFGFTGYWREWWHFEHRVRPARHLDLTLGC